MSEAQSLAPQQPKKYQLDRNQIHIFGRIDSFKRLNNEYITLATLPARDEFTRPQMVSISSKQALGQRGDVIQVVCTPVGYLNKFDIKDPKTGEVTQGQSVKGWFKAVE